MQSCWPSPGAGCLIPTETFNLKRLNLVIIYFPKKMKKSFFFFFFYIGENSSVPNGKCIKPLNGNILKAIITFIFQVLPLPLVTR